MMRNEKTNKNSHFNDLTNAKIANKINKNKYAIPPPEKKGNRFSKISEFLIQFKKVCLFNSKPTI